MDIVRITHRFPSPHALKYGLEPTLHYISREQVKLGLNVHVICKRQPHEKAYEEIDGVQVYRVPPPYNLNLLYTLLKLSRKTRIDIVHSHATSALSYAILRRLAAGISPKPKYVVQVHGTTKGIRLAMEKLSPQCDAPNGRGDRLRQALRLHFTVMRELAVWRAADAVVTNSQFLKNELVRLYGISREKIHVIYNGVDPNLFYPRNSRRKILKVLGLGSECKLILYLGGFRPVKGPTYVLHAMKIVHENVRSAVLLFVGGRSPLEHSHQAQRIRRLADSLIRDGAIQFIENIPHHQLPEYYSAADVVAVPSIYDAFPKVVLEALACGTPVVAFNAGGIPEMIQHGKTGFLAEVGDVKGLADLLIKVLLGEGLEGNANPDLPQAGGVKPDWESVTKWLVRVYENLLKQA